MKLPFRIVLLAITTGSLAVTLAAGEKAKSIEFQGRVSAVDLVARTITVRRGNKEFVFNIDIHRCDITRNGYYFFVPGGQPGLLKDARVGDAIVGKLSLAEPKPVVTRLYLMSKPESAVPVSGKAGYVHNPYQAIDVLSHMPYGHGMIDVRGYPKGAMIVDKATGKIFLVP